ncbi:MAG: ABC transporter substrate-binding protein, partial [Culicoidibacterales bacterium]
TENIILDRALESFTQETGIYVERESYTYNYSSIMTNKFQDNQAADVFLVSQMDYNYWQQCGWLKDVSHLVNDDTLYYDAIRETFTTDEQLYAIPHDFSAIMMYYNTDILHAAGFGLADIPETLADFPTFLEQLQQQLPEGTAAIMLDVQFENFMAIFEKLDPGAYESFDFENSVPVQAFISQLSRLVTNGTVQLVNENINQMRAGELFREQKAAITIEGNWLYNYLSYYDVPFEYQVSQIPKVQDEIPMATYFSGYAMAETTQHEAEASLLIEYLTETLSLFTLENTASFPANKVTAEYVFAQGNSNLDQIGHELADHLSSGATSGKDYVHTIYAYYFGLKLPELVENPEISAEIFSDIKQSTGEVKGYVNDFVYSIQLE